MRPGIYTVHAPLGIAPSAEKFVFIREGFSFLAFVAPLVWLVVYRVWRPLVVYVVVVACLAAGEYFLGFDSNIGLATSLLIGLYFGFEAAALRQDTLRRRGFLHVASVVGNSRIEAEQRYFTLSPPSQAGMTG